LDRSALFAEQIRLECIDFSLQVPFGGERLAELASEILVHRRTYPRLLQTDLLIDLGNLRPQRDDRRILWPAFALQLAELPKQFGTLAMQFVDGRAGQRLGGDAAGAPRSVLRFCRRARRAGSGELGAQLRQLIGD